MSKLMPTDIKDEVLGVLQRSSQGQGSNRYYFFLSSYQILDRLPGETRNQILGDQGQPGSESGNRHSSATVVAQAAEMLCREKLVEKRFLDNQGIHFTVNQEPVIGGNSVCAIYCYHPSVHEGNS